MFFDLFSKFVWFIVSTNFALSISIFDGYRYFSLFLFFLTVSLVFIKIDFTKNNREDFFIIGALFIYGASYFFFEYIDSYSWPDPSLPSRFFIVLPVMMMLFQIKDFKRVIWYGISLGAILAFIFAIYEKVVLGLGRANGGGLVPIMFGDIGMLLAFLSFISLVYFKKKKNLTWSFISFVAVFSGIGVSLLSVSRGSWVALPIVGTFLFWQCRSHFQKKTFLIFAFLIIAFGSCFSLVPQTDIKNRFNKGVEHILAYSEGGERDSSVGLRFEMWKLATYMFLEKPILGAGRESSLPLKKELVREGKVVSEAVHYKHSHNVFFDALGYRGLVGLAFEVMIYLVPFMLFYKKLNLSWEIKLYALAGAVVPLSYVLFGLTEVLFVHKVGVTIYAFYVGFFWVALRRCEDEDFESMRNFPT